MSFQFTEVYRNRLTKEDRCKLSKKIDGFVKSGGKSSGWVGGGSFAHTFSFGRGRVVRLEASYPGTAENFSGYSRWTEKVVLRSRSKHVPKVDFHAKASIEENTLQINDDGYSCGLMITVMEKLHEVQDWWLDTQVIEDTLSGYGSLTWEAPREGVLPKNSVERLGKISRSNMIFADDLHSGNIMLRKKDNRLVITDPIY